MNKFKIENLPDNDLKLLTEHLGINTVIAICEIFGGSTLYIPKSDIFERHSRNISIYEEYRNGLTYKQLARKYNLSTVTIRNIISSF